MHLCAKGFDFVSFDDLSLGFWYCFENMVDSSNCNQYYI